MLTRVSITNYRGFKSYEMMDLAQVNLLVGKNNSGKTALLEGIQFLASGGDPAVLAEAAERRGEVILTQTSIIREKRISVDIAHFFNGHNIFKGISFSIFDDNSNTVTATVQNEAGLLQELQNQEGSSGAKLFLEISGKNLLNPKEDANYVSQSLITGEGGVNIELSSRFPGFNGHKRRSHGARVYFIGPDSLNSIDMAPMWDEITLAGQEIDVAGAMRVIEPNLESVHFLTGMFAQGYFPSHGGIVVGIKGQEGRLPLGSMGDGMRRLMALAIALAFTKDGWLFIDEIDTGLHYSVLSDMWKMTVAKAVASNIQVFATTHSWDCIEGLSEFCQDNPELMSKVAIHKIDPPIPRSVAFTGESVIKLVKGNIDPR
jgi:hypothetical protein